MKFLDNRTKQHLRYNAGYLTVARFVKGMEALQTGWLHLGCTEIWGCHRVLAEVRERIIQPSVRGATWGEFGYSSCLANHVLRKDDYNDEGMGRLSYRCNEDIASLVDDAGLLLARKNAYSS
jgi:hypothetical protein